MVRWKRLIPLGLLWVLVTGVVVIVPDVFGRDVLLRVVGVGAGIALLLVAVLPVFSRKPAAKEEARS